MIAPPPSQEATRLLIDWSSGNREAAEGLMPLVYDELRRLARGYLRRERSDHTLQAQRWYSRLRWTALGPCVWQQPLADIMGKQLQSER